MGAPLVDSAQTWTGEPSKRVDVESMTERRRATELLVSYDRELWFLAVGLFGVGDLVTTGLGLVSGSIVEIGPVGVPVVRRYGIWGMVALKMLLLSGGYFGWYYAPTPERRGIPFGLAVVGLLVTVWNGFVLLATYL